MEKYKNKDWLIDQYWNENKSLSSIAKEVGVSTSIIGRYMKRFEIKRRTISESNSCKNNGSFVGGLIEDYEWVKLKIDSKASIRNIAVEANVSVRTSARWIKIHGLKASGERKTPKGSDNPRWTGNRICKCGKEKKGHKAKLCGECHRVNLKNRKGKLSKTWKGIADITSSVRTRVMPAWRKSVFEKDNYQCIKCKDSKGGNLEAHHIKRFSVIIRDVIKSRKDLSIENIEDRLTLIDFICNNEEINSIENGLTLCKKCHREVHKGKSKEIVKI